MKIIQQKISDKHNDSFWYRGEIAETDNFVLVATGDIRIINCETGEIAHDISKERGDGIIGGLNNDDDLKKIDDIHYTWDMNNWFEIFNNRNEVEIDFGIFDTYDEGIAELLELETELTNK